MSLDAGVVNGIIVATHGEEVNDSDYRREGS